MRKGQEKILEQARKCGYSDGCMKVLSREDFTLNQLEQLLHLLSPCKEKEEQWIESFVSINDYEVMELIGTYITKTGVEISFEELKQLTTKEQICAYFSTDNVICRNLFEVEVVLIAGYHNYTDSLLKLASRLHEKIENKHTVFSILNQIVKAVAHIPDYQDFLDGIENIDLNEEINDNLHTKITLNIADYIQKYAGNLAPFTIKSANGIPEEIQKMDFHGFPATIHVQGYSRFVYYTPPTINITYTPYYAVKVFDDGALYTDIDNKAYIRTTIFFDMETQEFLTEHNELYSVENKPAQLKELFLAISICDTEEDRQNAYSVIDFLCKKYNTYIFKDLYHDFLQSSGLFMPVLITEVAQYRTKQELFEKHYHMPVSGNWNKRNANLTYLILKLLPRMTDGAVARAMQCRTAPKIRETDNAQEYVLTYFLYETLYNVPVGNAQGDGLLADALYEEHQAERIRLLPEKQTIKEHNERQLYQKAKNIKLKIKENTRFQKLIDNMPENYELIRTPERLVNEGVLQKNCVANYSEKINKDNCMIYSVVFENVRHTVEITLKNGRYTVAQCYKSCNKSPDKQLVNCLQETIKMINHL